METILGIAVAGIGAGAIWLIKSLGAKAFIKQFGPVVAKTYDILDPIAGELIGKYDNSIVQQAIELAVLRVADGDIDHNDVVAVTEFVIAKFNPSLAASKVLDPTSEDGKATAALSASIEQLADGANAEELKLVARNALALV